MGGYGFPFPEKQKPSHRLGFLNKWCPDSESNQGHGDFQSPALPTELSGQRGALNRKGARSSTALHEKSDKIALTACFSGKMHKISTPSGERPTLAALCKTQNIFRQPLSGIYISLTAVDQHSAETTFQHQLHLPCNHRRIVNFQRGQ